LGAGYPRDGVKKYGVSHKKKRALRVMNFGGETVWCKREGKRQCEFQAIKNPHWAGFFYYQQSLSAQTYVFIAIVNVADNERGLQRCDVASCRAFSAIFNGEGDFLTFIKRFVVITLDSREMHEYIFAAIIGSDKAKTFI